MLKLKSKQWPGQVYSKTYKNIFFSLESVLTSGVVLYRNKISVDFILYIDSSIRYKYTIVNNHIFKYNKTLRTSMVFYFSGLSCPRHHCRSKHSHIQLQNLAQDTNAILLLLSNIQLNIFSDSKFLRIFTQEQNNTIKYCSILLT